MLSTVKNGVGQCNPHYFKVLSIIHAPPSYKNVLLLFVMHKG